jgi:hypothetical protein
MTVGAADKSGHVVARAAATPPKKPAEKSAPKSGVLSDDPCAAIPQKKLNTALKKIGAAYNTFHGARVDENRRRLSNAISSGIDGLSSDSKNPGLKNPASVWNVGACIVKKFDGNNTVESNVKKDVFKRVTEFGNDLSEQIAGDNEITNHQSLLGLANRNPEVTAYIEAKANLLVRAVRQKSNGFENFLAAAKMGNMQPDLFNAVMFRCTELARDEETQQSIVNAIRDEIPKEGNINSSDLNPLFRGNVELKAWAYATHGVLPEPHNTLAPWPDKREPNQV